MRPALLPLLVLLLAPLPMEGQDTCFVSMAVPDGVFARMQGKSYPEACPVPRSELRYLTLSYRDAEGVTRQGEMVCNKAIAPDLVDIFRQLWKEGYRIGGMRLVDDYGGDDLLSMGDNNTSCFNYRLVAGTHTISKHGRGMAVDVNPLYNPYVYTRGGREEVQPEGGRPFARGRDSRGDIPMKIDHDDLCYKLFRAHGFRWGGDWAHSKDYQHFER